MVGPSKWPSPVAYTIYNGVAKATSKPRQSMKFVC